MLFLLLARLAAIMATPVVTSRRPDPKDSFLSTLSVLSAATPGHFHKATLSKL
ncbi:hypothetical protein DPMN_152064 [Dreissena polymorpha]|uniref:Uncharacterized protein n=1 Tax=Dreissena polymorpha TaxID=45954 RepID=A0A9D4FL48_DREPO|nr:hypothetical protein DPMN_152064 [Dreissena polymorpha]